ncbi:MAG: SUMF1/EgtB/PvdO family nonheme iron enzyme, partial [Bacteroidia bacterium]
MIRQSGNKNLISVAEIDTLKWKDKLSYNEPYVHYYHSHPAYYNYPVVNISYEGAKFFCEWLTVQYNAAPKRKFKKVSFRLPSEEEWIIAAQAGNSKAIYPWGGKKLRNKKGEYLANFKSDKTGELLVDVKHVENADIFTPVGAYWKNDFGLYNMSGNV